MTTAINSPRQLFGRCALANADQDLQLARQVDEAIAAIEGIATSHGDVQSENDRLEAQGEALREDNRLLTQTNAEYVQKLSEAHKIITVLVQRVALSQDHIAATTAKLRMVEQTLDAQTIELTRLLTAISAATATTSSQRSRQPMIKLVGARP